MLNRFDYILIFSRSLQEHQQHVRLVLLLQLLKTKFVKAEKCSVTFLGYSS